MIGKSIRIYLADGSPRGLRHVEIANWSGQALACPRSRFSELKNWPESQREGVYMLIENNYSGGQNKVYVGESENVFKRLSQHDRKKDFWNEVIIFSSKDENLTKAHIKYLESRLTLMAMEADIYLIDNIKNPTEATLPRADKDAMEEFIINLKMILGTLGHRLLDPLVNLASMNQEKTNDSLIDKLLFLEINGHKASGTQSDDGFILMKGSEISVSNTTSVPGKILELKRNLIDDKTLIEKENKLILEKNIVLSSSSYAAALVAGTSRSGPQSWKDSKNKTLKTLEENLLKKK